MKPLDVAITQLGVEEKPRGSNWGEPVATYLKSVGITFAASWCMAFVYWCHRQAGIDKMARTGGVLKQWQLSKKLFSVSSPQPGDVFIMDLGEGLGHTGIVERVEGNILHTIEGNTNDSGSREGYEVCRKTRDKKSKLIIGYLRFG